MISLSLKKPIKPHGLVVSTQGISLFPSDAEPSFFPFPELTFSDLSIVDADSFGTAFAAWLTQQKKEKGPFAILLENDVVFTKLFQPQLDPNTQQPLPQEKEVKHFLESIPFASVMSQQYNMSKNSFFVSAVNRDLIGPLLTQLKEMEVIIIGVAPIVALDHNFELQQHDQETLLSLSTKHDDIKKFSFKPVQSHLSAAGGTKNPTQTDKKRLVLLIIVFFGLIMMMILLLIFGSE